MTTLSACRGCGRTLAAGSLDEAGLCSACRASEQTGLPDELSGDSPTCAVPATTAPSTILPSEPEETVVRQSGPTLFAEQPAGSPRPLAASDYDLLTVLGEGGMGVVYSARQKSLGREVAVKQIREARAADAKLRSQFLHEATVTGRLPHPNVVPVYELGEDERGNLFYSMKRIEGRPWSRLLPTLGEDENLEILLKVCDAVGFAHARGVMHRDLKPANVMVGEFGEVLVVDWGLALALDSNGRACLRPGDVASAGTPSYMAPEMALGKAGELGSASDIYLLGGILLLLATGLPPHAGKNASDCFAAAARNELQGQSHTGELVEIARRALAAAPGDRYRTVADLQRALRDYRDHRASLELSSQATRSLEAAAATGRYHDYAKAVFGFEDAVAAWAGNEAARVGGERARLAYAAAAAGKGDLDLADSNLLAGLPDHEALRAEVATARRERAARLQRLRRLAVGIYVAIGTIVATLSVAFFWIRAERNETASNARQAHQNLANAYREKAEALLAERDFSQAQAYAAAGLHHWPGNPASPFHALAAASDRPEESLAPAFQSVLYEAATSSLLSLVASWQGHTAAIESLSVSPDGTLLATAGDDGAVRLWRLPGGEPAGEFKPHAGFATSVRFSPDGSLVASTGDDGTVRVSHTAKPNRLVREDSGGPEGYRVAFSPDGALVAATARGQGIALASPTAAGQPRLLPEATAGREVAFSPDGRLLVVAGSRSLVWNLEENREEALLVGHRSWVLGLEFSADGSLLATASIDGTARLWDSNNWQERGVLYGHRAAVGALSFSPDGRRLATGSYDGNLRLWEVASLRLQAATGAHRNPVTAVDFSPRSPELLVTGDEQGRLRLWRVSPEAARRELAGHRDFVHGATFSPDGRSLVTVSVDGEGIVWGLDPPGLSSRLPSAGEQLLAVAFSPDGRRLVTGAHSGAVRSFPFPPQGGPVTTSVGGTVRSLSFSPDGTLLAAADSTSRLPILRSGDLAPVTHLESADENRAVAFSPSGKQLAVGTRTGEIRLWETPSWRPSLAMTGHRELISHLEFAPDGSRLVSAGKDRNVRVFDTTTGELIWTLSGHTSWVNEVRFTPDGQHLLSVSDASDARWWDLHTGKLEQVVRMGGPIFAAAISPDGKAHVLCAESSCWLSPALGQLWQQQPADIMNDAVATGAFVPPGEELP